MNSDQKSPIPSINSQGKITTENPELLSLLRENSTDRIGIAELSSPSGNRSAAETFKLEQPERLMKTESPEHDEDRTSPTNETPSREYFPEQSSGSPIRSKSVASVKEQGVKPKHVSQAESLIDSLEQPRRSEKLEDSLEVDDDPHAKHYDTEPKRTTPLSYPKPIPVESSTEVTRPSSRTVQEVPFEPDSTSSYSSRRLKGRDSSQRTLLQISSTSEVHPEASRAYPSSNIHNDDKDSYHFSAKDTGPIRDLLNTDAEPEAEDHIERSDAVEPRANSSKTYNVLSKEEKTDIVYNPEIKVETMDTSAPARMYVDSPTFTPQEEDEYRFVQSRLDDQEDFKDNATYRELDRNALKGDKDVALESNREWNAAGQKPDNRARDNAQKQYVMRPSSQKPSTTNSRHQPGLSHKKQIETETPEPFFPDSMETSTEDSELERERNYQKKLQERLANQVVTDADLLIPRLNLPDESVEYVRDSLDYDDDDDTYRDTDKTVTEFAVHANGEWVNPPENPYRYPQPQYNNQEYNAYQNVPEQYQNMYQGQQANQQYPVEHVQNAYQPQNQTMFYNQQMPYQGNPHQGYDPYFSFHPQEQQQQQQHPQGALARYPTQTEAEYFIELPQSKMDQHSSPSRSPRRPGVDYVEKNKQNVFRSKPGTTYSELKHRKFELEQQKAEKPPSRNIVKIGKINKPVKEEQANIDSENESIFQNENNAEATWKNRSVSLAQHKKGKPKGKKIAKLQKYPTDSGFVPTKSDQHGYGEKDFPGEHPNAEREALSTGDLSPSRRPLVLKPITQEVWTEDGQRISVDINLKLMSPPPAAGPPPFMTRQHPLGPISQEQHQGNAQVIYSARGPPTEWQQAMGSAEQGSPFHQGQGYVGYSPPQRNAISGHEGYGRQIPQPMYPNSKQHNPAVPLRSDFDKFRKHQHNVEQQRLIQQQIYQQQLAKKQQLQQQLQQLQLEGQVDPGRTYYQSYGDEGMYKGGYPSPRDQIDAPDLESDQQNYPASTTGMNPYNRIPPISMGVGHMTYAQPKESPLGYANKFMEKKSKEQRKPDYKVYTLDDYRKMQKEVRLGGLGPDMDSETFRDKAGKKIRQENYAREVMMRNKQTAPKSRPPVYPKQKETDDLLPRSRVAKEYAKNVPKPKVRPKESQYNSYEVSAQMSPVGQRKQMKPTPGSPGQSPQRTTPTNNIDVIDLQKLHQRHERDKHNVAMMRQNMEII